MGKQAKYDVVVVGAGTAGLAAARGARARGMSVAVVEATRPGGECLWWTCLPTKALLEAAHASHAERGIPSDGACRAEANEAYRAAREGWEARIAALAAGDSAEALAAEGIALTRGKGKMLDAHTVAAGSDELRAEHIVIAVGAHPVAPPIPGLEEAKAATYMHAARWRDVPRRLVIIGGGPVGCEYAQAFRRFGSEVTILERLPRLLVMDDEAVSRAARETLEADGVRVVTEAGVGRAERTGDVARVWAATGGKEEAYDGDALLVVTGRRARIAELGVAAAGLEMERGLLALRDTLQTSEPHIWACGDAAGGAQFRSVAESQGEHVGQWVGSGAPPAYHAWAVPHATFLHPEAAGVGMTEAAASESHDAAVVEMALAEGARGKVGGDARGLVKLVVNRPDGRVLGAHLVGPGAGDAIQELALAVHAGIPVSTLAGAPRVYPAWYEIIRRAAREAARQCGDRARERG